MKDFLLPSLPEGKAFPPHLHSFQSMTPVVSWHVIAWLSFLLRISQRLPQAERAKVRRVSSVASTSPKDATSDKWVYEPI